jgi:YidC/Oxa1 family membrane protein insertase
MRMLGSDQDQEMMRRQMTAIFLIGFIMMGWMFFFAPKPPPVVEPADPIVDEAAAPPAAGGASERRAAPTQTALDNVDETQAWPNLPPIPEQDDPAADEVVIHDEYLELVFTRIGGRLKRAKVLLGDHGDNTIQLVPEAALLPDTEAVYPLGLRFLHDDIRDELDYRRFDAVVTPDETSVTFSLTLPGVAVVRKTFSMTTSAHVLDIDVTYENLEGRARALGVDAEPSYILNWGPGVLAKGEGTFFKPSVLWWKDDELEKLYHRKMPELGETPEDKRIPDAEWIGSRTKYFLSALKGEVPDTGEAAGDAWVYGYGDDFRFGVQTPRFAVEPGAEHRSSYALYLGPMEMRNLDKAWPTLSHALTYFDYPKMLDSFAKMLLRIMNWFHGFIPNYGVSIILLTVLVRLAVLPLTMKSMKSMKGMQTLQPEIKELQEKYKDDQQASSQAMMELYRERGINPLGGCLPMFIQMPVFISLYRMIMYSFEVRGEHFLWMDDLSLPDRLFHLKGMLGLPLVGDTLAYVNLLPILMVVAMVISFKLSPTSATQNPQQRTMMMIMPVFFGVISYRFSAGINLYVLTSTVLGILQQQIINRSGTTEAPKKKVVKSVDDIRKKRKQHFYNRAQERKRQQAKAAKKGKKKK